MTESAQGAVYPVPPGWRVFRVDDIKATEPHSCVAGPFGSNIASRFFVDQGVPIIRGSNLKDDLTRFVADDFAFVSETRAREEYQPQHVKAGERIDVQVVGVGERLAVAAEAVVAVATICRDRAGGGTAVKCDSAAGAADAADAVGVATMCVDGSGASRGIS